MRLWGDEAEHRAWAGLWVWGGLGSVTVRAASTVGFGCAPVCRGGIISSASHRSPLSGRPWTWCWGNIDNVCPSGAQIHRGEGMSTCKDHKQYQVTYKCAQLPFTNISLWLCLEKFPGGLLVKICLQYRRCEFDLWVGKIPWGRKRQPTPVFLPGKCHQQRSLEGYSPWGGKELDTIDHSKYLK